MASWETEIERIYTDPKKAGSFSGGEKLRIELAKKGFHVGLYKINQWLQQEESYSVFKQLKKKFKTNKVLVSKLNELWDVDLISMQSLSKENDGYSFILLTIDILSKFIHLVPLSNKTGKVTAEAFESIFVKGAVPLSIRSDSGGEFLSNRVSSVFKKYKINFYTALNLGKANVAERCFRTVKNKIFRYLEYNKTDRYIDVLQNLADSYNATVHSSIGIAPKDVNISNQNMISWVLYWPRYKKPHSNKKLKNKNKLPKFKFKIGASVRISTLKHVFSKESTSPNWTRELFKIKSRAIRDGIPVYKLAGFDNKEIIRGSFYQQEIQRVNVKDSQLWKIKTILKTRKVRGQKKQALVRWENYSSKYDSWINIDEVKDL